MATSPTIGLTRCRALDDYLSAVRATGARAVVLDDAPPGPPSLDGLLLTGGGDIAAARYGAHPHLAETHIDAARDRFELDVARRAADAGLPVLGICRGLQVLNVLRGGTLIQDIPAARPGAHAHQVSEPPDALAHWIRVEPGSRLARLLEPRLTPESTCRVNSRHHQAPGRVAAGFRVVATAPDGIVEALEHEGERFCLGVQWHPENFWRTGEFDALFDGFVRAAAGG